jgi:hypothetical protein
MNFAARDSFALWFGIVSFCIGSLDIFVGLILLVVQDKRYAQGFLISGGVLVLVGFATCTSAL